MEENKETAKKPKNKRKRIIWFCILGAVLLLLVIGGTEAYRILYTPQNLFTFSTIDPALLATATPLPTPEPETGGPDATTSPTPVPTPSPTPGITEGKDVLNILLIGIDRRQGTQDDSKGTNGGKDGTDPHADVQMIVAINFKAKTVDLISLPRDTFIHNTELMNGVYKINATFNVGGGFDAKDGAGFKNICKGAEYMLGGIPVDYYYAVDFDSLVKVVDAIGGVDFNVESASYSRKHKKGMQHMDGLDVLFFVRVRKSGPEQGDLNRINRQKELMIAIFTQLKEKGKLSMVPDLINAANSGVYTNTNLEQTLALANFAMSIDPAKIGMHSMTGPSADALGWRWCFTDQTNRAALIKQIYGIDVPEQVHCSEKYAHWLSSYGFRGMVYLKTAKPVLDYAEEHKAEFTAEQQTSYDALMAAYTDAQKAWDVASLSLKSGDNRTLINAENKLKSCTTELAKLLGYKEALKWTYDTRVSNNWVFEPKINEIMVDFR
jgi:LCP family protein required for cell wall assembly